ncbi:MAG: hypothetical protein F6K26_07585 [Moorea sp. SIO2I5]|nr:hypothetical protein [Moorena sp. SIO2I5]
MANLIRQGQAHLLMQRIAISCSQIRCSQIRCSLFPTLTGKFSTWCKI